MGLQALDKRQLLAFDANTSRRFERLAFAVRDFLQAVSEYHPLVMIVDNIQWADLDSLRMIQYLLSTKSVQNFLLVGCHEPLRKTTKKGPQSELQNLKDAILSTDTRITEIQLKPFDLQSVEEILCSVFLDEHDIEDDGAIDRVQDLGEILFALTKGNTLWMMNLLRLLNDLKLLTHIPQELRWDWNRKKIKKAVKGWIETNDKAFSSCHGVISTRLQSLPKKIKFVVEAAAALGLTSFKIDKLFSVFKVAYSTTKEGKDCPIQSQEELETFVNMACTQGIFKRLSKPGFYKFSHDLVRDAAYTLLPKKKKGMNIHFRMGTELQVACLAERGEERERLKFLAVDQLNRCVETLDVDYKAQVCKLNLEASEIAVQKTAFRTAVEYLEKGMDVLDHTIRWQQQHYDLTLRIFLGLARMRLCCGRLEPAKAACDDIFENSVSLKDRVQANHVYSMVLFEEEQYRESLQRTVKLLSEMGEVFPKEKLGEIVDREISNLRKALRHKDNKQLLNPPRMTDKKMLDVMVLFANLVEISRYNKPHFYLQLATIRMMHLSLKFGFTRQYPLAFSLFGVCLIKKGLIKEAHRVGQIAEKIARLGDFYGGEAVALFHWHISHWRRTYKVSLEPVLKTYNAQIDSGDFHHVDFSISTYAQYHLASGYDLERLSDNLQLFDGIYSDYALQNTWHIILPQQVVANMLGESANPLIFFGDTIEQENTKIQEWEAAGEHEALHYFYFLRLFMAFFFHDAEVAEACLEKLTKAAEGVWIPWMVFLECYYMIQRLPGSKGKIRKELKEKIEVEKGKLIDWFNEGSPNPNAMVSILEAELVIANKAKGLAAMKVQGMYDEAIEAAQNDGATHLEAFALERAGLHFHATGVQGFSAQYLNRAHQAYDRWHAIAKVIDIETEFAEKLKISKRRQSPASAYLSQNQSMRPGGRAGGRRKIGGGQGEVKAINLKKVGKNLGKGIKRSSVTVKGLFAKKEHAEPAAWGFNSKTQLDDEAPPPSPNKPRSSPTGEDEPQSAKSSKTPKRVSLFGKKAADDDEKNDVEKSPTRTSYFSPRSQKPLLNLPFGRKKKGKKVEDDETEDNED
jgi:predicted ATPase